jgi:hypothetical protein
MVSYKQCNRTFHLYVEEFAEYLQYNESEESEFVHFLSSYPGKDNWE